MFDKLIFQNIDDPFTYILFTVYLFIVTLWINLELFFLKNITWLKTMYWN